MTLGRGREEGIAMGAEGGGREKRGVDDGNEAATEVSLAREGGGGTMVASRDGAALDTRASCKQGVGMDRSCAEATSMDGIHGNIASLAILMSPKAASWWTAELWRRSSRRHRRFSPRRESRTTSEELGTVARRSLGWNWGGEGGEGGERDKDGKGLERMGEGRREGHGDKDGKGQERKP